jgi:hypothetical protein
MERGINKSNKSISKGVTKIANTVADGVVKTSNQVADGVVKVANQTADGVVDTYGIVNRAMLKADVGGYIEQAQKIVPQSLVSKALMATFIAAGMPPQAAEVAANSATSAFYDVDFSKSLKGQGKSALKAGAKGGFKSVDKLYKGPKVAGGSIEMADTKGIHSLAHDFAKGPIHSNTNDVVGGAVIIPKPKRVARQINKVAEVQAQIQYNPNLSFGGSMVAISGSSMLPISGSSMMPITGSSMRPIGSGVGGRRFVKGSQEAKDFMKSLRDKKKKG